MAGTPPSEVRFRDPVDPQPAELRTWAYHPAANPLAHLPPDWDLLIATDRLVPTLFELAADPHCPARLFALHCLYIYAAETLLPNSRSSRRCRNQLHRLIDTAARGLDDILHIWAHNCRTLHQHPGVYRHEDWIDGGLARRPIRLNPYHTHRPRSG